MKRYRIRIPPDVQLFLKHLPPLLKSKIRGALEELEKDPWMGKPLKEKLRGFHSYRVSKYRIVYQMRNEDLLIQIVEIAERSIIYQKVLALLN